MSRGVAVGGNTRRWPFFFFRVEKGNEYRVADPARGVSRTITAADVRVLELCDGDHTLADIATKLAGELGVMPPEAGRQVDAFLSSMAFDGLIAWRELPLGHGTRQVPPPRILYWDVTKECNLRCLHCYNADQAEDGRELAMGEMLRTLEEAATFGVREVSFSGGEPLLRAGFLDVVAHARKVGFEYVGVATNGTLLDDGSARRLAEAGASVQISIDGDTAETHDRARAIPGSFDAALRGIQLLKHAGAHVKVCMTASRLNVARVPQFVELMRQVGVSDYRVQAVTPAGRARTYHDQLVFPPRRLRSIVKYLLDKGLMRGGLDFTFEPPKGSPTVNETSSGACSAATSECSITWDGRVVPCTYFASMAGENVRDHSFRWIWESSRLLAFFRDIRKSEIKGYCRQCPWLNQCHGGCKAESYIAGDVLGTNPCCWVAAEHGAGRERCSLGCPGQ